MEQKAEKMIYESVVVRGSFSSRKLVECLVDDGELGIYCSPETRNKLFGNMRRQSFKDTKFACLLTDSDKDINLTDEVPISVALQFCVDKGWSTLEKHKRRNLVIPVVIDGNITFLRLYLQGCWIERGDTTNITLSSFFPQQSLFLRKAH